MNFFKINNTDRKWYDIILWWELRRIPYNGIMIIVGLLSFFIGYVTMPVIYLLIGVGLNLCYTVFWLIELILIKARLSETLRSNYPKYAFIGYLILSTIFVFGFALSFWF